MERWHGKGTERRMREEVHKEEMIKRRGEGREEEE